jgi:23S rRNA (adenine-N6)-dimethyltransferase
VVSNPPFHLSTLLLHYLLEDPRSQLVRADLLLSWGHAIGLTTVHPPPAITLPWLPWYELLLTRRLPARFFRPVPSVDVGLVSIRRRAHPMLDPRDARQYRRFLKRGRSPNHDVWQCVAAFYRWRRPP